MRLRQSASSAKCIFGKVHLGKVHLLLSASQTCPLLVPLANYVRGTSKRSNDVLCQANLQDALPQRQTYSFWQLRLHTALLDSTVMPTGWHAAPSLKCPHRCTFNVASSGNVSYCALAPRSGNLRDKVKEWSGPKNLISGSRLSLRKILERGGR